MRIIWCFSCLLFFCSFHPTHDNLKEYYRLIYQAEGNLCYEDYGAAVANYCAAFKKRTPFYADLRNAFKTALLSKDSIKVEYIWDLIKKEPDLVNDLKNNVRVLNLCPTTIKSRISAYTRQRKKTAFELIMDSIRAVDQQVRKECPNNLNADCKERFYRTDSANIKFIASLLGRTSYSETIQGEKSLQACFLVAWHARRWGFTDLDNVLYAYIKNGRVKPSILAQLIEYRSDIDSVNKKYLDGQPDLGFGATSIVINNHLLEMNQSDSLIEVVNSNRKRYYLDSLEKDIPKNVLLLQNTLFKGCSGDLNLELFRQNMPEEDYKVFLSDLTQKGAVKKLWF